MSHYLYSYFGYGSIINTPQWYDFDYTDLNNRGLLAVSIGDNMTGEQSKTALIVPESFITWNKENPVFLIKVPIILNQEDVLWEAKIIKWCNDNSITFEPACWMIMNWLG